MADGKIAVIGGAGFVGNRLAKNFDRLGRKYLICDINTKNRSDNITYLDVEDKKSLEQLNGFATIVNLAAVHRDDVRPLTRYDDVNVQGALNLCEAARKYNIVKIIFTSSVAIYGFAQADTDESGSPNYFNDYGRTKFLAEGVYKEWQAEDPDNRTLVIVRPTVIFGEGNRGNVYNLLRQIASCRFVMFGDGKNKKSMAYIENVTAFLEYSLSFTPGVHIYNYTDKPDLDMDTLVSKTRDILFGKNNVGWRLPGFLALLIGYFFDAIAAVTNRTFPVSSVRVKKFLRTTQFKSSIAATGFIAPVSLEEGLAKTVYYEFIEDNSRSQSFNTE